MGVKRFIDLGAKQLFAAEKTEHKIAVEIKSFVSQSEVEDLRNAVGQFILYHDILACIEPDRMLFIGIRNAIFVDVFQEPIGKVLLDNQRLKLVVFDPEQEVIIKWIS